VVNAYHLTQEIPVILMRMQGVCINKTVLSKIEHITLVRYLKVIGSNITSYNPARCCRIIKYFYVNSHIDKLFKKMKDD
jgi:hypothetical protein